MQDQIYYNDIRKKPLKDLFNPETLQEQTEQKKLFTSSKGLGKTISFCDDKEMEKIKARLLNGETIRSNDTDFAMLNLKEIQRELREQGLNVVYTPEYRGHNWRELRIV